MNTAEQTAAPKDPTPAAATAAPSAPVAPAAEAKAAKKAAVKAGPAKKKAAAPKAAAKAKVAKPAALPKAVVAKPAPVAKPPKPAEPKKTKLVRDSFTIPRAEYQLLQDLKQRAATLGRPSKKSEVLRAGIKTLAALADAAFTAALAEVPVIKTGRPAKT